MDKKELSLNKIIRRDTEEYTEIAFQLSFGEVKETLWSRRMITCRNSASCGI